MTNIVRAVKILISLVWDCFVSLLNVFGDRRFIGGCVFLLLLQACDIRDTLHKVRWTHESMWNMQSDIYHTLKRIESNTDH